MQLTKNELTRDITQVDVDAILAPWQWLLEGSVAAVVMMTSLGDLFLMKKDNSICRLQTDQGELTPIADSLEVFEKQLRDVELVDEWFLPGLVTELLQAGIALKGNEVYRYRVMPVVGGTYSVDNIYAGSIAEHFSFTGSLFRQLKDLPDGTAVKIVEKG